MNTRLKNLHDNKLFTVIKQMEQDLAALNSAPQFAGGDNVVYFPSTNESSYDWTGTVATDEEAMFLVTLTGAPGSTLYCMCITELMVGSLSSPYHGQTYFQDVQAGNIPFSVNNYTVPTTSSQDTNINQVICVLEGDPSRTAFLKFYAYALEPVTIAVERLS